MAATSTRRRNTKAARLRWGRGRPTSAHPASTTLAPTTRTSTTCARRGAPGGPRDTDLMNAPKGKAPTFLLAALQDPIAANLDAHPDRERVARVIRRGKRPPVVVA